MAEYHFIGIGGIGMGKLASLLLSKEKSVSGSDVVENAMVQSLRRQGARIFIGHQGEYVQDARYVIYSSAIKEDNPELIAAVKNKCHIFKRAQLLAELMKDSCMITVAGAHGKTTTTSMIAHMLTHAGLDPTVALGGVFNQGTYRERLGKGKYFVAELDESDGSFLFFSSQISVITNIDFEHVDHYGDWEHILEAYARFIAQTPKGGIVLGCGDDEILRKLLEESSQQVLFYGVRGKNDILAQDIAFCDGRMKFRCCGGHKTWGDIRLAVPGQHNVLNALACVLVGLRLGLDFSVIQEALASYAGVKRRFEAKGCWGDVMLFDDYAHHPTEIRATLRTARELASGKVIAVFQPHRYTRTKFLWNEFLRAFGDADEVVVTDIYAASEHSIAGVDSLRLCEEMSATGVQNAGYGAKDIVADMVVDRVHPGDLVVTLGAGDITKICDRIAQGLNERFAVKNE